LAAIHSSRNTEGWWFHNNWKFVVIVGNSNTDSSTDTAGWGVLGLRGQSQSRSRYEVETPAAMGRYNQCVLADGITINNHASTGRRQPWWLNESLKKCDGECCFHDIE
jgi:hypothetical protein